MCVRIWRGFRQPDSPASRAAVDGFHHAVLFADGVPLRFRVEIDSLLDAHDAAFYQAFDVGPDLITGLVFGRGFNRGILGSNGVWESE
jgi:hypothetical protein